MANKFLSIDLDSIEVKVNGLDWNFTASKTLAKVGTTISEALHYFLEDVTITLGASSLDTTFSTTGTPTGTLSIVSTSLYNESEGNRLILQGDQCTGYTVPIVNNTSGATVPLAPIVITIQASSNNTKVYETQ